MATDGQDGASADILSEPVRLSQFGAGDNWYILRNDEIERFSPGNRNKTHYARCVCERHVDGVASFWVYTHQTDCVYKTNDTDVPTYSSRREL